jgi:electron transport complex protein RnfB
MLIVLVIIGLALLFAALLWFAMPKAEKKSEPLAVRIDAILPQTQCRQCGYAGCKPYAEAIAGGEADINQCPPGGDVGIRELANLLGREFKPLNTEHGVHKPKSLAVIDEDICIGCTLCLQACPVDAILGAAKHMHTVIASECTGCELCVAPCPVDCISLEPVAGLANDSNGRYPLFNITLLQPYRKAGNKVLTQERAAANLARERHEFRLLRMEREKQERAERQARKAAGSATTSADAAKKAAIAAAIERARAQKAAIVPANTEDLSPAVQAEIAEIDARRRG